METQLFKNRLLTIAFVLASFAAFAQTITKTTSSAFVGIICPVDETLYKVSLPSTFGNCQIKWTATNGTIQGNDNQQTVSVKWNDTPGAKGKIEVKFSACGNGNSNEGAGSSMEELIMSVNGQAWDTGYTPSYTVDYCNPQQLTIGMPAMYVQGTGGSVDNPPLMQVVYRWTLPDGWKYAGTSQTGSFATFQSSIDIVPTGCAKGGQVKVYGTLYGSSTGCNSAAQSATATISLNSNASPGVTINAPSGYTGSHACDTTPVTFTASLSPSLACVNSYEWTYSGGWSFVSQSGNTISLRPTGNSTDQTAIGVKVKFTCGSNVTSTFTPAWHESVVSGPSLLCTTGTFSVSNPVGVPITWSSSNTSILSIASQADGSGLASRVTSHSGNVKVTATFPCATPPIDYSLYVGVPDFPVAIDGPSQITVDYSGRYNISGAGPGGDYTWSIPSPWYIYGNGNTATGSAIFVIAGNATLKTLTVSRSNICGSSSSTKSIWGISSSDCNYNVSVSPNPAKSNEVVINIIPPPGPPGGCNPSVISSSQAKTTATSEGVTPEQSRVVVIRDSGEKILERTFTGMETNLKDLNLKSGIYYVKIQYRNNNWERKLIIN